MKKAIIIISLLMLAGIFFLIKGFGSEDAPVQEPALPLVTEQAPQAKEEPAPQKPSLYSVDDDTIVIGITLPLTGDSAYAGEPVRKAIELAFRDIKKERKLKYKYKLVFEDDKLDSKQMLSNYTRLTTINKARAIISMWSKAAAISPVANKDGIIHMGCAWGMKIGEGYYNLNHSTFPNEQIPALINILRQLKARKVGLIYSAVPGDQDIMSILIPTLKGQQYNIVFENVFNMDQKDFRTEITKMQEKFPDVVINLLISPTVDVFIKQAQELNFNPVYTGLDTIGYKPELFEGSMFVTDATGTTEFIEYFKDQAGDNVSSCVANLYDGLRMVIEAYETTPTKSNTPKNDDVVGTLTKMKKFKSVTGDIYIDIDGNIHTKPEIRIIKKGKPEVVEGQ
jgi:branched-chain amino acid transport system substrate-binding protein